MLLLFYIFFLFQKVLLIIGFATKNLSAKEIFFYYIFLYFHLVFYNEKYKQLKIHITKFLIYIKSYINCPLIIIYS